MELVEGGMVRLEFQHSNLTTEPYPERFKKYESGDTMHGRVVRCEPPKLLSHTWGSDPDGSVVTFELSEVAGGVHLVLTHSHLPNRAELVGVSSGWHAHLGVLEDRLSGTRPRPFWSEFAKLEPMYESRIPQE